MLAVAKGLDKASSLTGSLAGRVDLGLAVSNDALRAIADAALVVRRDSYSLAAFAQGSAGFVRGALAYAATAGLRVRW